MDFIEGPKNYKTAIGDFIVTFAQVEAGMSIIISLIKGDYSKSYHIAKYFALPLNSKRGKVQKLDNFINTLQSSQRDKIIDDWNFVKSEIEYLSNCRHHLVHGTGLTGFYQEKIKTMLDEKLDYIIQYKEFSIDDIKQLTDRTHHLLTGLHGIQGDFFIKLKDIVLNK